MTATALLEALRCRGVILEPAGERLRFRPREAVPPDLRAVLVAHKAELLALLREPDPLPLVAPLTDAPGSRTRTRRLYAFPWPDALPGFGQRRVQAFDLCAACGSGTWVTYGATALCLACARGRATGEAW